MVVFTGPQKLAIDQDEMGVAGGLAGLPIRTAKAVTIDVEVPADAEIVIEDLAGDGDHYSATVLSEAFRGKSRVQQHQIVYEALKGEMGGKLHALALQTGTPER